MLDCKVIGSNALAGFDDIFMSSTATADGERVTIHVTAADGTHTEAWYHVAKSRPACRAAYLRVCSAADRRMLEHRDRVYSRR